MQRQGMLGKDCWQEGEWKMEFKRSLNVGEAEQWGVLENMIKEVRLSERSDQVKWVLEKSGQFSTKSMYRMLAHRGVINYRMRDVWRCKIPLKIKFFMWQVLQNRLQTAVNLKRRKWKGSHKCVICGEPETEDHILFRCSLAKLTWTAIKEALGWDRPPTGTQDFLYNWVKRGGRKSNLVLFCLATVWWSLWTTRNKFVIEGVLPTFPTDVLYKSFAWMQKWKTLLKEDEKATLEAMIKTLRGWTDDFVKTCKNRPTEDSFM